MSLQESQQLQLTIFTSTDNAKRASVGVNDIIVSKTAVSHFSAYQEKCHFTKQRKVINEHVKISLHKFP